MKFHLLLDGVRPTIGPDDGPEAAPVLESLDALVAGFRAGQEALRNVAHDDLVGLCDAAAAAWTRADHPHAALIRREGLGFLPFWMRRANLTAIAARSLRGHPEALDRFVRISADDPLLLRAQPRGLAVHWVAGNVPVLGLLSLLQSALCKNGNLLKVSRVRAGLLPHLLAGLADVRYTNSHGQTVSGDLLLRATGVVYADRHDEAAARALSRAADVRVAWGGMEAVEAIMQLPRRFGTEDIVFGPKLSLAIVGAERLDDESTARATAKAIAGDACAFAQQGCNSPHTVLVERGGGMTPEAFARQLAEAMETECRRVAVGEADPATTMNVLAVRTEYDMRGTAYYGSDLNWTVVYADDDRGLATPYYQRTVFVRPVNDVFDAVPLCSKQTQSVGLAVDRRRLSLADALTAAGVERCPNVGAMRLYDTPWDGLFPMDRFVRWVTTY
jgi:hypothetical protein